MQIRSLAIDAGRRSLEVDGEPIELTVAEFDLRWLLAENAGMVLSRDDIFINMRL